VERRRGRESKREHVGGVKRTNHEMTDSRHYDADIRFDEMLTFILKHCVV